MARMLGDRETSATEAAKSNLDPGAGSRKLFNLILLGVSVLNLIPIWLVDFPGMVDYPNHLVRCYILAHLQSDPVFLQRYVVLYDPIPNLAIESIVVPLNHLFPILLSGKIFLTLEALLFTGGCVALGFAITGKRSWIALATAFAFYNSNLFFGFVNYIFGLGVFLCVFAFWLRSRGQMQWSRFALLCVLSLVTFLAHLSAIVFLGVACVSVAAMDLWEDRRPLLFVRRTAWLVCPAFLMLAFMKKSGQVGVIEWSTLTQKVIHLFAPIRSYNLAIDAVVVCLSLIAGVTLLRKARIHRIAVVGAVLLFLFLVTPHVLFTSYAADARYVMPAFLVAALSIEPAWTRRGRIVFALLLAALIVRSAEIDYSWWKIDQRETRLLHMGDHLQPDAHILVLEEMDPKVSAKFDRGFPAVLNFWTVTHNASVSTLFTNPGQQPIIDRTPQCQSLVEPGCVEQYDYVWTNSSDPARDAIIRDESDNAVQWDSATLWHVRHQGAVGGAASPNLRK